MIPKRHPHTTRWLGAPLGWEPERQGICGHLAVADVSDSTGHRMLSRWEPTPEELAALNAGGSVELSIVGVSHPPVWISVAPPEPALAEATT